MATLKYALTSDQLTEVIAIRGKIQFVREEPIYSNGNVPVLYKRYYNLTAPQIIYGNAIPGELNSITFSGFTQLATSQRFLDLRLPILNLDGQSFFDSDLPSQTVNGLIFIGGPDIPSIRGFIGNKAMVENDKYKGQPVRAFLLAGINASLSEAIPLLLGWQNKISQDKIEATTQISHPLISLDALRILSLTGSADQIDFIARWLIHSTQSTEVKITAIELLGDALSRFPKGSKDADKILEVLAIGWETEHAYSIEAIYIRTLQATLEQLKGSNQLEKVKAIANDYQMKELNILLEEFKDSLEKK